MWTGNDFAFDKEQEQTLQLTSMVDAAMQQAVWLATGLQHPHRKSIADGDSGWELQRRRQVGHLRRALQTVDVDVDIDDDDEKRDESTLQDGAKQQKYQYNNGTPKQAKYQSQPRDLVLQQERDRDASLRVRDLRQQRLFDISPAPKQRFVVGVSYRDPVSKELVDMNIDATDAKNAAWSECQYRNVVAQIKRMVFVALDVLCGLLLLLQFAPEQQRATDLQRKYGGAFDLEGDAWKASGASGGTGKQVEMLLLKKKPQQLNGANPTTSVKESGAGAPARSSSSFLERGRRVFSKAEFGNELQPRPHEDGGHFGTATV